MAKENKKKEEKEEKNLLKNYIILVIILLLVVGLTIYLCECYKVYNEEQKTIPVIRGTLVSERTILNRKSNYNYVFMYSK